MKKNFWSIIMVLLLGFGFGVLYFNDHAWGAWGDDSAGYIFLAGRMFSGLPLVYDDELATRGLHFFGDEKLARWLTPTHHAFIHPDGTIASKYPIGAPLLMFAAAKLLGTRDGFYIVTPFLAAANIILVYLLGLMLFSRERGKHIFALFAAVLVGTASLYYNHAIAQPMREIPSITFLLCTALLLVWRRKACATFSQRTLYLLVVCAGLSFGMAFNIRETSLVIAPALLPLLVGRKHHASWKHWLQQHLPSFFLFLFGCIIAILPSLTNAATISAQKVAFKQRDITRLTIVPNINHVRSFSIKNLFDNQGRFLPGVGTLPHYWEVLQEATPIPFFLLLVGLGILGLWQRDRRGTVMLIGWCVAILTIFSLWINPYSRYILPLFPPLMLLGSYGLSVLLHTIIPALMLSKRLRIMTCVLVVAGIGFSFIPTLTTLAGNLQTPVYEFKAISHDDLRALEGLGTMMQQYDHPVVLFSGTWQYGISETFEAHTGVKAVRFPLEQRRFAFQPEQVEVFFDKLLGDGYDLVVWSDHTSSAELYQWLAQQKTEELATVDFSFEPNVRLTHILSQ